MSSNIQRLGDTLAARMSKTAGAAVPMTLELGQIGGNLSLTTDSIKTPIPKGEYMVSLNLQSKIGDELQTNSASHTHNGGAHSQYSGSGVHSHSDGDHAHVLPETMRGIKAGDRVLVAWCGNEPVVVAIVTSS